MKPSRPTILPPIRSNAGTTALYRKKLIRLIAEMHESVLYWLSASYKANEPVIAQDELPAEALRRAVQQLSRRWQKQFDEAAPKLAKYFAKAANQRSARQLQRILAEAGFSVEFKMTRAMQDVMKASVNEQVSLIRSIPQKYFADVQGAVMRSVSAGRDLESLVKEIGPKVDLKRINQGRKPGEAQKSYAARTARRAAFIARDQNNKMTAVFTRVRQQEAGISRAIWVHSGGGKEPRPSHVAAGRRKQEYDVTEGWYDPDVEKHIFPGELPNCRCVSRAVITGFS